jgi:hypothetical protein
MAVASSRRCRGSRGVAAVCGQAVPVRVETTAPRGAAARLQESVPRARGGRIVNTAIYTQRAA